MSKIILKITLHDGEGKELDYSYITNKEFKEKPHLKSVVEWIQDVCKEMIRRRAGE